LKSRPIRAAFHVFGRRPGAAPLISGCTDPSIEADVDRMGAGLPVPAE
jgi:hypothetical protein